MTSPVASIALVSITEKEIDRVIRDLPTKKSNDSNQVFNVVSQTVPKAFAPLEHIINVSFNSGNFPSSLKSVSIYRATST